MNFGEVWRAQLAKSTLLTSTMLPLGTFQIFFRSVQTLRRKWGAESKGKLRTYSSLQPWFPSLRWKTCLWAELQPWCLSWQWKTYPWTELWLLLLLLLLLLLNRIVCRGVVGRVPAFQPDVTASIPGGVSNFHFCPGIGLCPLCSLLCCLRRRPWHCADHTFMEACPCVSV